MKGVDMDNLTSDVLNKFKMDSISIEDAFEKIKMYISMLQKERDVASKKLQDYSKEDGLNELRNEYYKHLNNAVLIMTDDEKEASDAFKNKHYKKCKNGSIYWYKLVEIGVGTSVYIKCDCCGEELDITDFSKM